MFRMVYAIDDARPRVALPAKRMGLLWAKKHQNLFHFYEVLFVVSAALIPLSSFAGDHANSMAIISLSGDKIKWRIIKDPVGGDFFAPHEAVMMRACG